MSSPLAIEMVSDIVCPWCWLGLRRLRAAVGTLPDTADLDVKFRPFQLDPTVPQEGLDYRAYMSAKFGPDGPDNRWKQMREALEQYGDAEGIPFDFKGLSHRPNTLAAHRLVRWAQGQSLGWEAKEALFAAYFRDHRDIGAPDTLIEIGSSIGLDGGVLASLFSSGADMDTVQEEERLFRSMGVGGVPIFIAARRYALQGAQDTATLAKFLIDASEKLTGRA